VDAFTASLRAAGVRRKKAGRLATLAVAAIEGAVVLCRARHDTSALDDVGRELEAAIESAPRR
jgi:TetR/AcrR family transcriptional regulator, lmrAB and yxaGH operons repressor